MITTLERIYNVLASGDTSSVGFISQIFAKFCVIGYGSMFLRFSLTHLMQWAPVQRVNNKNSF